MDAFAGEGVEVGREGCHKGFTFTGFHFGDTAFVDDKTADKLDAVMLFAEHAPRSFAHGGKGVGQDIIEGFACGESILEHFGCAAKLRFAKRSIPVGQRFDFCDDRVHFFDLTFAACTEDFGNNGHFL